MGARTGGVEEFAPTLHPHMPWVPLFRHTRPLAKLSQDGVRTSLYSSSIHQQSLPTWDLAGHSLQWRYQGLVRVRIMPHFPSPGALAWKSLKTPLER